MQLLLIEAGICGMVNPPLYPIGTKLISINYRISFTEMPFLSPKGCHPSLW